MADKLTNESIVIESSLVFDWFNLGQALDLKQCALLRLQRAFKTLAQVAVGPESLL